MPDPLTAEQTHTSVDGTVHRGVETTSVSVTSIYNGQRNRGCATRRAPAEVEPLIIEALRDLIGPGGVVRSGDVLTVRVTSGIVWYGPNDELPAGTL